MSQLPMLPSYLVRPAQKRDSGAIRRLTRQMLSQVNLRPSGCYKLFLWLGLGLGGALVGSIALTYPHIGRWVLALSPLLGMVGLGILLLGRDELAWNSYWLLVVDEQVVGCGRLESHESHAELYDLVIDGVWRRQGLGTVLVAALMAQGERPMYLASLPGAIAFYQRQGFVPLDGGELDPSIQRRLSLTNPRFRKLGLQPMVLR
jgi:N-acetylglutamate synthase-like GNAT family acetyltransferase